MTTITRLANEKLDLFRRGSFHILTALLLFSVAFTNWYTENVTLFVLCTTLIMINSIGVEYYLIRKYNEAPPQYIGKFLALALPYWRCFMRCNLNKKVSVNSLT